jgi:hypothetical protein
MKLPDIELVAAEVHAQWMTTKRSQGITSRKAEDGEELMVPYKQLSEKAKELDRGSVRAVYDVLVSLLNDEEDFPEAEMEDHDR